MIALPSASLIRTLRGFEDVPPQNRGGGEVDLSWAMTFGVRDVSP